MQGTGNYQSINTIPWRLITISDATATWNPQIDPPGASCDSDWAIYPYPGHFIGSFILYTRPKNNYANKVLLVNTCNQSVKFRQGHHVVDQCMKQVAILQVYCHAQIFSIAITR